MLNFDAGQSPYYYYVCPRDRFLLPSLELVEQDVFLYRTLRAQGYERIVFAVKDGYLHFETYDRFSEYAFRYAGDFEKFQGGREGFLKKHTPSGSRNSQEKLGRDRIAAMNGDYAGRDSDIGPVRMKQPFVNSPEKFEQVFQNLILTCLQSEKVRTAFVFPEESFDYFSAPRIREVLRKFISGDGYRRGSSIVIFTMPQGSRLVADYMRPDSFYQTVCRYLFQTDVKDYLDRNETTALLGLQETMGPRLIRGYGIGVDEAGWLLDRAVLFNGLHITAAERPEYARMLIRFLCDRPGEEERRKFREKFYALLDGYLYDDQAPLYTLCKKLQQEMDNNIKGRFGEALRTAMEVEKMEQKKLVSQMRDANGYRELEEYFNRVIIPIAEAQRRKPAPKDPLALERFSKEGAVEFTGEPINLNLIITGPTGVGKNTLVQRYGQWLASYGLLKKGHVVVVTKDDVKAQYVGQSSAKLLEKVDEAEQGVLVFDEFYQLDSGDDHGPDSYNKDIVDALLKLSWERRGRVAFVLVGYEEPTMAFIRKHEGLEARFPHHIRMEEYTSDQLYAIFRKKAKDIRFSPELEEGLPAFFKSWYNTRRSQAKEWSNIRTVENEFFNPLRAAWLTARRQRDCLEPDALPEDLRPYWEKRELRSDPWQELDGLVGLPNIRQEIEALASDLKFGVPEDAEEKDDWNNYLFLGNPGTGKTEVARKMGRILLRLGVIRNGVISEVKAGELLSGADPLKRLKDAMNRAMGGILFVDEAYRLRDSSMGIQALENIMQFMEDNRGSVIVIFAGYEDQINELLAVNDGLASRFTRRIIFEDYTAAELCQIAEGMAQKRGFAVSEEFLGQSEKIFSAWIAEKKRGFGNAREVRNYIKRCKSRHSVLVSRAVSAGQDAGALPNRWTLTPDDIPPEYRDALEAAGMPAFSLPAGRRAAQEAFARIAAASSSGTAAGASLEETVLFLRISTSGGTATGTAFLASPEGDVVTCAHCVRGARKIEVRLVSGNSAAEWCPCTCLFADESRDIAVIRLERGQDYPFLVLAEGEYACRMSEPVRMPGFPKGLQALHLYNGRVAALDQRTKAGREVICLQIEGKHGNSGSPVLLEDGRVGGIFQGAFGETGDEVNFMAHIRNFWTLARETCGEGR